MRTGDEIRAEITRLWDRVRRRHDQLVAEDKDPWQDPGIVSDRVAIALLEWTLGGKDWEP